MTSDTAAVRLAGVDLSYGKGTTALTGVTVDFQDETIVGLIGRNGAGKSSLMRVVAAREPRIQRGRVTVFGVSVLKSPAGTVHLCGEKWPSSRELRLCDLMRHLRRVHDRFDEPRAVELLTAFGITLRRYAASLSRGQRSAAYASLALASRASITLLDEPQLGMDAPSRALLYQAIVEEQALLPRTMVMSTHLINETAGLFERVVVLDRGRVAADAPVDELCASYVRVEGQFEVVSQLPTLQPPERLGTTARAIVKRDKVPASTNAHLSAVSLQELSSALTTTPGRQS